MQVVPSTASMFLGFAKCLDGFNLLTMLLSKWILSAG